MKRFLTSTLILTTILVAFVYKGELGNYYQKGSVYVKSLVSIAENNNTVGEDMPEVVNSIKSAVTSNSAPLTKKIISSTKSLSIDKVIYYTNINRQENGGLVALTENTELDRSAEIKMKDMFAKQYFEHVSPSGVSVSDLANTVGYEYVTIGENLALGDFATDKELVDAWMASPGHRANILNKRYTEIGVAVGRGSYQGRQVWLAVQHFGAPKSTCPIIDEALHSSITTDQTKVDAMNAELATRKNHIDSGGEYNGQSPNQQIEAYNSLVATYNNLVKEVKAKVDTYNAQVRAFNTCVGPDTTTREESTH
jgi:uncharacterized protein YkwD